MSRLVPKVVVELSSESASDARRCAELLPGVLASLIEAQPGIVSPVPGSGSSSSSSDAMLDRVVSRSKDPMVRALRQLEKNVADLARMNRSFRVQLEALTSIAERPAAGGDVGCELRQAVGGAWRAAELWVSCGERELRVCRQVRDWVRATGSLPTDRIVAAWDRGEKPSHVIGGAPQWWSGRSKVSA
jgi:hypothetical protein